MSWRKYLMVPRLAALGLGRGPEPGQGWDWCWQAVQRTGPGGDVLWDGAGEQELAWWDDVAHRHLNPLLPVLDVGCGNGRISRRLAPGFPHMLGVDLSQAAVDLARRESLGASGVRFRRADITQPDAATSLVAELGAANVVVRGVLHVLDDDQRRQAAASMADVLGDRGTLVLAETNWTADLLGYPEHLGGRHGRVPRPLQLLIRSRLPRPTPFGPDQLTQTFRTSLGHHR